MTKKVSLTKEESRHLNNCLKWGHKSRFAKKIGKSNMFVTALFKPKDVYNIDEQRFMPSYSMDLEVYNKLIAYIKTIK